MDQPTKNQDLEPLPTTPEDLFEIFEALDIKYKNHHHAPIFTVEEGLHLKAEIPGLHCRNLFLRDKKKRMYLVVAANETQIDLKKLPNLIGSGRLSFGSKDRLWTYLGIRQGSVSPFCALNDTDHQVHIILDAAMMDADLVNYHPMDNAMTVSLSPSGLINFFEHTGHEPQSVDFYASTPEA